MVKMKPNKEYIEERDKLHPFAEMVANKEHGARAPFGKPQLREQWRIDWTRTFLGEMDRLARVHGIVR